MVDVQMTEASGSAQAAAVQEEIDPELAKQQA